MTEVLSALDLVLPVSQADEESARVEEDSLARKVLGPLLGMCLSEDIGAGVIIERNDMREMGLAAAAAQLNASRVFIGTKKTMFSRLSSSAEAVARSLPLGCTLVVGSTGPKKVKQITITPEFARMKPRLPGASSKADPSCIVSSSATSSTAPSSSESISSPGSRDFPSPPHLPGGPSVGASQFSFSSPVPSPSEPGGSPDHPLQQEQCSGRAPGSSNSSISSCPSPSPLASPSSLSPSSIRPALGPSGLSPMRSPRSHGEESMKGDLLTANVPPPLWGMSRSLTEGATAQPGRGSFPADPPFPLLPPSASLGDGAHLPPAPRSPRPAASSQQAREQQGRSGAGQEPSTAVRFDFAGLQAQLARLEELARAAQMASLAADRRAQEERVREAVAWGAAGAAAASARGGGGEASIGRIVTAAAAWAGTGEGAAVHGSQALRDQQQRQGSSVELRVHEDAHEVVLSPATAPSDAASADVSGPAASPPAAPPAAPPPAARMADDDMSLAGWAYASVAERERSEGGEGPGEEENRDADRNRGSQGPGISRDSGSFSLGRAARAAAVAAADVPEDSRDTNVAGSSAPKFFRKKQSEDREEHARRISPTKHSVGVALAPSDGGKGHRGDALPAPSEGTDRCQSSTSADSSGSYLTEEGVKPDSVTLSTSDSSCSPRAAPRRASSPTSTALSESSECRRFTSSQIRAATDNYSPFNLVGKGAFGPVFRGELYGCQVAVKKLDVDGWQGSAELQMEVEVLSRLRHPHIVLLMGHCPEEQCVVYELMSGGSLREKLQQSGAFGHEPLFWVDRLRIASELAGALLYMHQHEPPILHRDLKPGNVLLDRNMMSKIADVGLARVLESSPPSAKGADGGGGQEGRRTGRPAVHTGIKGTIGYIDPEHIATGVMSEASDLYALGLTLLQLLTGLTNVGEVHDLLDTCFIGPAQLYQLPRAVELFMEQLDQAAGMWSSELAEVAVLLALRCVDRRSVNRPSLAEELQPKLSKVAREAEECFGQEGAGVNASAFSVPLGQFSHTNRAYPRTLSNSSSSSRPPTGRRSSTSVLRDNRSLSEPSSKKDRTSSGLLRDRLKNMSLTSSMRGKPPSGLSAMPKSVSQSTTNLRERPPRNRTRSPSVDFEDSPSHSGSKRVSFSGSFMDKLKQLKESFGGGGAQGRRKSGSGGNGPTSLPQ